MRGPLLLFLGTVGAAAAIAPAPPAAAQAQRDWTRIVAATPEGGFRVGNPAAAVKLVEYGSLTCGHCARFAAEGVPELLAKYVKAGRVSFEFRNFVRDPADVAGALLSRCAGPSDFFALTHRYFAAQPQWIGKLQALPADQQAALGKLPPAQVVARTAALSGLSAIATQGGVPAAKAQSCLASQSELNRLLGMLETANGLGITGTPAFLVNGKPVEPTTWAGLEPLLASPGG